MQKRTAPVPVIFCSVIGYMEIYIKVDRRSQIIAQISETGKISKDRVERPEGRRLAPENGDIFGSIFGVLLTSPRFLTLGISYFRSLKPLTTQSTPKRPEFSSRFLTFGWILLSEDHPYVFHHLPETRSKRSRFCQKVAAGGGSRFSTVQGPARGVCPHVFYKFQRSVEKAFFESQSLSRVLSVNHVAKENTRAKHCVGKSLACEALHVHAIQLICVK